MPSPLYDKPIYKEARRAGYGPMAALDIARETSFDPTNRELAEAIYDCGRALQHDTMLSLIQRVAAWGPEELNSIDPNVTSRQVTERDQLCIIAELANIMCDEY